VLTAEGVVARRGGRRVLDGADISLPSGAVIGLGGETGSGKTTLGYVLAGRLAPDAGRVALDGRALPAPRPHVAAAVQLAPQSAALAVDPRWRVRDALGNAGEPDSEALAALGVLDAWADRRPAELSGGELARVSLARLIHPGLRALICDEVTAELDALSQAALWDGLLRLCRARGIGVLVISHDAHLRAALCDRSVTLAHGAVRPE